MNSQTEETDCFPNEFWATMEPYQFSVRYAPVTYGTIARLVGVSESTVGHWMQNPKSNSYRKPKETVTRLLALSAWLLDTFKLTPDQLANLFEERDYFLEDD